MYTRETFEAFVREQADILEESNKAIRKTVEAAHEKECTAEEGKKHICMAIWMDLFSEEFTKEMMRRKRKREEAKYRKLNEENLK